MKVIFSEHAERQIKIRKLLKAQIIDTVNNYDEILSSYKNRKLRRKEFGSKIMEVVTITEDLTIVIVTAYFLEEKYEN